MDPFISGTKKQFLYYKLLGEKAMSQLEPEQLFVQHNENSNSIAVIIKHMSGNMLSRWTDFRTTDGEKAWRNRDEEFHESKWTREVLLEKWNAGWECLFNALDSIEASELSTFIYIRNEGLTIMDAIIRQLAHYTYHVGQIVYCAKQLRKEKWESLSIPKDTSAQFNKDMFERKMRKDLTNEENKPNS